MSHKCHWTASRTVNSWRDLFDSIELHSLAHFRPGAVEKLPPHWSGMCLDCTARMIGGRR